MKRKKIPLHLLMIRGTLGKQIVIRHTPWGVIIAKYPDMSKVKASDSQRACRNIFREAVVWAKQVIKDPMIKEEWQKKLRRPNGVYNEAIKLYMTKAKANEIVEQKETSEGLRVKDSNGHLCPSRFAADLIVTTSKKSKRKRRNPVRPFINIGLPKGYCHWIKKEKSVLKRSKSNIRQLIPGTGFGFILGGITADYHSVKTATGYPVTGFSLQRC